MSDLSRSTVSPTSALAANASPKAASDDPSLALAFSIAEAADERKGANIRILKMSDVSYLADYFVIVTGFSAVQVRAIARNVVDQVEDTWHRSPMHTEGQQEGTWLLQDYGDVIVHVFMPEEREFYGLEAFWGHAEDIPFEPPEPAVDV